MPNRLIVSSLNGQAYCTRLKKYWLLGLLGAVTEYNDDKYGEQRRGEVVRKDKYNAHVYRKYGAMRGVYKKGERKFQSMCEEESQGLLRLNVGQLGKVGGVRGGQFRASGMVAENEVEYRERGNGRYEKKGW